MGFQPSSYQPNNVQFSSRNSPVLIITMNDGEFWWETINFMA